MSSPQSIPPEQTKPAHVDVGIGLRRGSLMHEIEEQRPAVDFLEVAPENWMRFGGPVKRRFEQLLTDYPLYTHGLSLSIGGPAELDTAFVRALNTFLDRYAIPLYSEHLSFCSDDAHLYDLMPIPFTRAAVDHVVERINRVQDILGRRLVLENISYYTLVGQEMAEIDFINEIVARADCQLLLDINNVYVNSVNHGYSAEDFLDHVPIERVRYFHVAGHQQVAPDLIIDTHGAAVADPVWSLLERAYRRFGPVPTLLERDFDIPPLDTLMTEVATIRQVADRALAPRTPSTEALAHAG